MANVGFLQATQKKIEDVLAAQKSGSYNNGVLEGAFYLTSDSNRLYIGKKSGSNTIIAPINAGIIPVDSLDDLQNVSGNPGEFYYIKGQNILCVRSGSSWVQINQVVTNAGLDGAVSQLKDAGSNDLNGANVSFTITDSKGDTQVGNVKVQSIDETAPSKKTLDVKADASTGTVNVLGDAYALAQAKSGNDINVSLSSDFQNNSSFKVKAGDNVTLTSSTDGFTVAAKDTTLENGSFSATAVASGYSFTISDNSGNELSTSMDPAVKLQDDNTSYKFANGTMNLPVYNKTAIDNLASAIRGELADGFKTANAMTYKGTIGSADSTVGNATPPTSKVAVGDVYLADQAFTLGGKQVPAGGLIIAKAAEGKAEGSDGYLAAADIEWTVVSGNSTDTTYTFLPTANGIALKDSHGEESALGLLDIKADGVLTASYAPNVAANKQVITVTHNAKAAGADTPVKDSQNAHQMTKVTENYAITYVSALSFDDYGHIAGVTTSTHNLVDTNLNLDSAAEAVTAVTANKEVKIQTTINATKGNGDDNNITSAGFSMKSLNDNLVINKADNAQQITMNLVWGEFK